MQYNKLKCQGFNKYKSYKLKCQGFFKKRAK